MFKGKKILIIGGTGTIGRALAKRLFLEGPAVIRIFSRDEFKQSEMAEEMKEHKNIRFLLGDIRDLARVERAMEDIDIVFHTAALKQVPACEYNPFEAVKTNVIGTQNVIDASLKMGVKKVIFTSTDKTIGPTNTYGATKLLAERLVASADYYKGSKDITFAAVRFGNVMGSRGSVIPLFKKQIIETQSISVTDMEMSRFMMTQSQAIELLLRCGERARGGEVFILKMPIVKLQDLAEVVIEEVCRTNEIDPSSIIINRMGFRPGEKMYEELMTLEESKYAIEFNDMFAVHHMIHDSLGDYGDGWKAELKTYSSHEGMPITKQEIRDLILAEELV